jgi:glycosyltransferase involved in cell wall biosynthesis
VIPSKIFEAMAMQRPIILGVKGESHAIIEKGSCGLSIEPENDEELAAAAMRLANDGELGQQLGDNGRQLIESHYSRDLLAKHYIGILEIVFRI